MTRDKGCLPGDPPPAGRDRMKNGRPKTGGASASPSFTPAEPDTNDPDLPDAHSPERPAASLSAASLSNESSDSPGEDAAEEDNTLDGEPLFDLDAQTIFSPGKEDVPTASPDSGNWEQGPVFAPGGDLDALEPDVPPVAAAPESAPDPEPDSPAAPPFFVMGEEEEEEVLDLALLGEPLSSGEMKDPGGEVPNDDDDDEVLDLALLGEPLSSGEMKDPGGEVPNDDDDEVLDLALLGEPLSSGEMKDPDDPDEDDDDIFELDPVTMLGASADRGAVDDGPDDLLELTPDEDDDVFELDPVTMIGSPMDGGAAGEESDDLLELTPGAVLAPDVEPDSGTDAGAMPGSFLDLLDENEETSFAAVCPDNGAATLLDGLGGEAEAAETGNDNVLGFLDILGGLDAGKSGGSLELLSDASDGQQPFASPGITVDTAMPSGDGHTGDTPPPAAVPAPDAIRETAPEKTEKTKQETSLSSAVPDEVMPAGGAAYFSVTPEQMEAALERVVEKIFAEKIDHLLRDIIEKAVAEEVKNFGGALMDSLTRDL